MTREHGSAAMQVRNVVARVDPEDPTAHPSRIEGCGGLVRQAAAYTGSAWPPCAGTGARVPVSDRGTLGGLTQFVTQFGFTGSATSL